MLRPAFEEARTASLERRELSSSIGRIFVSVGSTDPGNYCATVLEALNVAAPDSDVDIVLASSAPFLEETRDRARIASARVQVHTDIDAASMIALMSQADIAIGAGGISSYERCCLGLPTLAVETAVNQRAVLKALSDRKAVRYLGLAEEVSSQKLADGLLEIRANPRELAVQSLHAAAICDGSGIRNIVTELMK